MLEVNNIFKMCESDNFSRLCRICTAEGAKTGIYGDEGVKNKLEAKIKNYLHIEVSKEDLLPKVICTKCSTKIEDHHSFASLALQMQVKLYSMVKIKGRDIVSSSNGQKYDESDEEAEEEEEEEEENEEDEEAIDNQEDEDEEEEEEDDYEQTGETSESGFSGSLLHSILTNGRQSHTREQTGSGAEVMEVEVSLDPMLFLSGQDDNGEDGEESSPGTAHSSRNEYSSNGSDREVKDSKPYNCSICPRGFNTEISLQSHLWSHLSRKVLTNTDLNARLRNHRRGSVYSSNGVLHTIEEAPLGHPYLCPVCGKQISTKGNLKVHLETHRPKGKYACDICGRIFKTQSNLYRHKEYHGGDQYTCEVCSRVYPTKSTLRAHSITHSDLRPHQCPLCDKTFKRNQDLKFHINQHTGARPYKCPFCPKAFASSGNCFSHRKRMHPSEQQKYKANGYVQ